MINACEYFFDQKEKFFKDQKGEQDVNLKKKRDLIAQINNIEIKEDHSVSFKELKALIEEWNEVGHVTFKEKEKVYKEYKAEINAKFDKLKIDQT